MENEGNREVAVKAAMQTGGSQAMTVVAKTGLSLSHRDTLHRMLEHLVEGEEVTGLEAEVRKGTQHNPAMRGPGASAGATPSPFLQRDLGKARLHGAEESLWTIAMLEGAVAGEWTRGPAIGPARTRTVRHPQDRPLLASPQAW